MLYSSTSAGYGRPLNGLGQRRSRRFPAGLLDQSFYGWVRTEQSIVARFRGLLPRALAMSKRSYSEINLHFVCHVKPYGASRVKPGSRVTNGARVIPTWRRWKTDWARRRRM